jgi:hypothetical protein
VGGGDSWLKISVFMPKSVSMLNVTGGLMGSADFRTATYRRQENSRVVDDDECSRGTHL